MVYCTIATSCKYRSMSLVLRYAVSVYGWAGFIALTRSLQTTPPLEGARATRERTREWKWREKKGSQNFMNDVSQFVGFFFLTSPRLFLGLPYFTHDEEAKNIARMIIFLRRSLAPSLAARFSCHPWSLENSLAGYCIRGRKYDQTTAYPIWEIMVAFCWTVCQTPCSFSSISEI